MGDDDARLIFLNPLAYDTDEIVEISFPPDYDNNNYNNNNYNSSTNSTTTKMSPNSGYDSSTSDEGPPTKFSQC